MNTTQWAINEISAEYTGRVHMVINFIKEEGENKHDLRETANLKTGGWIPYGLGVERIVALACSLPL